MLAYIDRWLDQWADWRRGDVLNLGHSSRSPVHRMMTTNAATTKKTGHRPRRQVLRLGDRLVERHTDHMRATETRPAISQSIEGNPRCEMMDRAVCSLPNTHFEVVRLKYAAQIPDIGAAAILRVSEKTYRNMIDQAHFGLDGWLKGHYGNEAKAAMVEIEDSYEVLIAATGA